MSAVPAQILPIDVALTGHQALVLDTCVLIDGFRGHDVGPLPRIPLGTIPRRQRVTSVVALWEFLHGAAGAVLSAAEQLDRQQWLRDQGIGVSDFDKRSSKSLRSLVRVHAGPPSAVDCMLAAFSVAHGLPFFTANVRHFAQVPGLRLVG